MVDQAGAFIHPPRPQRLLECIHCELLSSNTARESAIFCSNSMVTSNPDIGESFQCNIYSYVAHDCRIGDFVTFAPQVCCNGNVRIEDNVYVGTGAVLRQGRSFEEPLVIGVGSTIGMGAVVTKDVPPGATVVGNPARPIQR